jgi:hypothetical protein
MDKEILVKSLVDLQKETIGIELYFLLKSGDIKLVELEDELSNKLQNQFLKEVNFSFNKEANFSLLEIDKLDDERANTYYYFDSKNMYEKVSFILEFAKKDNHDKFSTKDSKLSEIGAFLIKIGNQDKNIILYKNQDAFNLLKKDTSIKIFQKGESFEEVESDILSITSNFDFLLIDEHLIIKNLKTLERTLSYTDVIHKKAISNIELIKTLNFLENLDGLEKHLKTTRLAKKFNKAQASPVIKIIQDDIERVIEFIKKHPVTKSKLKLNGDDKLILDTKISVEVFLKLLDDDYLQSELTKLLYDSRSKDGLND